MLYLTPLALVLLVGWLVSTPGWRGPVRGNFDGRKFHNAQPIVRRARDAWREGWPRRVWPKHVDNVPFPAPPARVPGGDWRVTWVGHATVLVQGDGLNILTDPVWSPAAGPLGQLGPRRSTDPGVPLDQLPTIDLILLSHNHYDHLDVPTLQALHRRDRPVIVTPLGNGTYLAKRGIPGAIELGWDDTTEVPGARVWVTEARHFSGRGFFDRDRNLWGAFVVELASGKLYFGGDTGYGPHFAATAAAHGPMRLALLPIGAYLPVWMMQPVHTDPAEAVQAHADLRAGQSLGIHWGAFPLAADNYADPPRLLAEARAAAGLAESDFFVLRPGEGVPVRG